MSTAVPVRKRTSAPSSWLLLFVAYESADGPAAIELSPLHIQKGMFLFSQAANLPTEQSYTFRAEASGPLSPELCADVDRLAARNLLSAHKVPGIHYWFYKTTDEAKARAAEMARQKGVRRCVPFVEVIRGLLQQLSLSQLVSGICAAYPAYSIAAVAPDLLPMAHRPPARKGPRC